MKIEYTLEQLTSVVDVLRDIERSDFWGSKYFYSKTPKEKKRDNQEMEKAVEKARDLLGRYDSEPTFENAKEFVNYATLDTNIIFSLKKLRKMVYGASKVAPDCVKDRLIAQESILCNSGVPVRLKPLLDNSAEIVDYIKKHYKRHWDLDSEQDGNRLSRLVFTDTFWADRIAVELLTQKEGRQMMRYREDYNLRTILNSDGQKVLIV